MERSPKKITATCSLCEARGKVALRYLSDGTVDVVDYISHKSTCSRIHKTKQAKHLRKKEWVAQEKRANNLVGARETLMSGAVNEDGDGRAFHEWRVECKKTKTNKYRLTHKVWEKLCTGAIEAGEEPLLHLQIGDMPARLVVVREDWLDEDTKGNAGGCLEVKGKGISIYDHHIKNTPMWIEGMEASPWILTENEFEDIKRRRDESSIGD